nr:hypothetical protein HK105_000737 [Polyrhizophydium stewartii]
MPVLLSNVRIFANYKGETWNVCDAVFNPTTLDRCDHDEAFMQEMLELALGCLKDTEGITYDKSTFRIEKDAYYGSYGWNDKTGESEVEDASLGMPNPHVTDDSGGYSPSIKDPHSQISIEKASTDADTLDGQLERPLVAIKDLGARLKIVVMLPGVASSSEIDYRFARRHLRLKAGDRFQLDLQLPCDIVPASESGEYVKSKCRLNLFVSKVDP